MYKQCINSTCMHVEQNVRLCCNILVVVQPVCPCMLHLPLVALILSVFLLLSVAPALSVSLSFSPPPSVSSAPSPVLLFPSVLFPPSPSVVSSPPLLSSSPPLSFVPPAEPDAVFPALHFLSGNVPSVYPQMTLTKTDRKVRYVSKSTQ